MLLLKKLPSVDCFLVPTKYYLEENRSSRRRKIFKSNQKRLIKNYFKKLPNFFRRICIKRSKKLPKITIIDVGERSWGTF